MLFGQCQQLGQIIARRNRTLRIGRRAEIGDRHAIENLVGQARVIGQEIRLGAGGHENRLSAHGRGGHGIDLIERVRDQDRRALAVLGFGAKRDRGIEQPLARAIQRHDPVRSDLDAIAPPDPSRNRAQQRRRALIRGIFAEICKVFRQHLPHEIGHRVARLADGHGDGFAAGSMRIQQRPQTRECVFGQVRKPLGINHRCLICRGHFAPLFCITLPKHLGFVQKKR